MTLLLLRRAVLAVLAAGLTLAALVVLLAWAALQVSWAIPEPAALAGPTQILDRDGELLARFTGQVDRREVALDDVAEVVRDAVVVAEDRRFYEHEGVDPLSLVRAVATNVRTGGMTQGGSTLTQQYVKSAFVGDERTLLRKVREAVIAIQLERDVSKEQILERYLNEVYFGRGAYGIEAAARTYFDLPAAELDAAQAATLAQLLPAPSVRNPVSDPEGARRRRDALLAAMGEQGVLSPAEVRDARSRPVETSPPQRVETRAPAFVDHVRRQLEHAFGSEVMLTGGLTVRTSLDLDAQRALDAAVAERVPAEQAGDDVEAAAVALDPRSGEVLAMHGGRDMRVGDLNLATMVRRQNGSAFKPFVYAAALEEGLIQPGSTVAAPGSITIDDCVGHDGGPITVGGGPGGRLAARQALVRSVNTAFQALGCDLGGERIVEQARRLGVRNHLAPTAAMALGGGAYGASPLDLASAYGTFANDGAWCPPETILEITGQRDESIEVPPELVTVPDQPREPRDWSADERDARPGWLVELADERDTSCRVATHPSVARAVTDALTGVVAEGTGTRARIDRPQAGKTGTSQQNKDAWFAGYTPQLSLAVWIGDAGRDGAVDPLPALDGFATVSGGTVPALLWADVATAALAEVEPEPFPEPRLPVVVERAHDDGPRVAPAREVPDPLAEERARATAEDPADADEDPDGEPPADEAGDPSDAGAPGDDQAGGDPAGDDPTGDDPGEGPAGDPAPADPDPADEQEEEDDDCLLLC